MKLLELNPWTVMKQLRFTMRIIEFEFLHGMSVQVIHP
jgi:hypothetical protein